MGLFFQIVILKIRMTILNVSCQLSIDKFVVFHSIRLPFFLSLSFHIFMFRRRYQVILFFSALSFATIYRLIYSKKLKKIEEDKIMTIMNDV